MLNTERGPLCLIVASVQGKVYSIDKTLHCIRNVTALSKALFYQNTGTMPAMGRRNVSCTEEKDAF